MSTTRPGRVAEMYEQFFGLRDEPFRLTPDPRYLYLSRKHAEALAHLRLGLRESSGFVCITGDVGTGKTTLLRAFLSELGPNVAAAYTYVPPLSAFELLRQICREFGLPIAEQSQSDLLEQLRAFLMAQLEEGRLCVVIFDEAQALSIDLLEQIRLLLNLETETQKLLRIVLVGQPQLRRLLLDPELAQLNQRITLRWHLGPLSYRETAAYISHRLTVASGGRATQPFTRPSLRLLHSVSGGVPRLINMIAHRSLLAAFMARQTPVKRRFVMRAYREIQAVPLPGTLSVARKGAIAAVGLAIGISLVVFGAPQLDRLGGGAPARQIAPDQDNPGTKAVGASAPAAEPAQPSSARGAAEAAGPTNPVALVPAAQQRRSQVVSRPDLERRLAAAGARASATAATRAILMTWHAPPLDADETRLPDDLETVAWRRGLYQLHLRGNRSMMRLLDLPALVKLQLAGEKEPRYAALTGVDAAGVVLLIGDEKVLVHADVFDEMWSGEARILWRDFDRLGGPLRRGAAGAGVFHLQKLLRRAGHLGDKPTGRFDADTEAAVIAFQRAHHLQTDGVVGPLTRIVLYATAGEQESPTLTSPEELS